MRFNWNQLEAAVTKTVSEGKIGTPRALRVTLHIVGEETATAQLSDAVISAGVKWFEGESISHWSNDSDSGVKVSMTRWANGCSALVSVSTGSQGSSGGDFTFLGSKGSIYHRFGGGTE